MNKGRTIIEPHEPQEPNWRGLSHLRPAERERIQSRHTPAFYVYDLKRDAHSGTVTVRQSQDGRWSYELYGASSHVAPSRLYGSAEEARDAAAKMFARAVRRRMA